MVGHRLERAAAGRGDVDDFLLINHTQVETAPVIEPALAEFGGLRGRMRGRHGRPKYVLIR